MQTYIQIEIDGCFDHPWHLASRPDQEVDTGCLRRETVWRIIYSTLQVVLYKACDMLGRILGTIPGFSMGQPPPTICLLSYDL